MIDLRDRIALVTGGSRGIGRATALLLARAGADVGITYHQRRDEAEQVAEQVRALGRRSWIGGADLADGEAVDRLFRDFASEMTRLDLFIANHGIWPPEGQALRDMDPTHWRRTLAVNLDGVFLTTRAALRLMGPGGRVVLISSTAGQRGEGFHADYAASKGAIISLVKSLAVECAPGITVNAVAPGWVDTDMAAPAWGPGIREQIEATIPLRRIPDPEDIAGPVLFLCSDLARHVTGEILNVNGGSVLCG